MPYTYDAFEEGHEATGNPDYLRILESLVRFAHEWIPVTELDDGAVAAGYSPFDRTMIVNASAYRGYLLASAGERFRRAEWTSEAGRITFVLAAQRSDGSWPYGATKGNDFIDNFHTCIVLKNLFRFWRTTGRAEVLDSVRHGYAYYRHRLLDKDLQPIPFARQSRTSLHRRNLYDYAEGINLALLVREVEPEARKVLQRLVMELATGWALRDGHFVTRRLVIGTNKVPYHRWAQSQVFHALASYCVKGS